MNRAVVADKKTIKLQDLFHNNAIQLVAAASLTEEEKARKREQLLFGNDEDK